MTAEEGDNSTRLRKILLECIAYHGSSIDFLEWSSETVLRFPSFRRPTEVQLSSIWINRAFYTSMPRNIRVFLAVSQFYVFSHTQACFFAALISWHLLDSSISRQLTVDIKCNRVSKWFDRNSCIKCGCNQAYELPTDPHGRWTENFIPKNSIERNRQTKTNS